MPDRRLPMSNNDKIDLMLEQFRENIRHLTDESLKEAKAFVAALKEDSTLTVEGFRERYHAKERADNTGTVDEGEQHE
jgi:proline dehydrogenase